VSFTYSDFVLVTSGSFNGFTCMSVWPVGHVACRRSAVILKAPLDVF